MLARRALALVTTILIGALCVPADVSAFAETQIVAGARVAAVADKIARGLVVGRDRTIAPAYAVSDQSLPAGGVQITAAGTPFVTPTYLSVPIALRVDGKLARTVVAGYRVTIYVHTATAARDLAPGRVLAESDLALARIASNGRPAVGLDVLVGRKLNSATVKGAPLYVEQTVADTVVKPGQAAILLVRDGIVVLTVDVVARTGGAIGDTVTVFNPQTQKAIAAVVTGPNRVELTLPSGDQ